MRTSIRKASQLLNLQPNTSEAGLVISLLLSLYLVGMLKRRGLLQAFSKGVPSTYKLKSRGLSFCAEELHFIFRYRSRAGFSNRLATAPSAPAATLNTTEPRGPVLANPRLERGKTFVKISSLQVPAPCFNPLKIKALYGVKAGYFGLAGLSRFSWC